MLVCDKCGAAITEGSKFCPQCGDPVDEKDKVKSPATQNQIAMVEITFGKSTSPNYQRAIDICKNIPTYTVEGEGNQKTHTITLPITEVELLINLYDIVGSWKSSKMLINGQIKTKKDLIYHGIGCYRKRQKAYNQKQYCYGEKEYDANIWGCKKLGMPIYEWGGGWLAYGNFDNSGVWHFDKNRIKHDLELKIKENELCPILDRNKILKTLEKLPNTINPKTNNNWEYQTNYEEVDGDYKEVAVGIKPVIKKVNKYVIDDFKPNYDFEDNSDTSNLKYEIEFDVSNAKNAKWSSSNAVKNSGGCLISILMIFFSILVLLAFFVII